MEQVQVQVGYRGTTDELLACGEDLAEHLEFVGFDSAPTSPERAERASSPPEMVARAKPRRERRANARARPHAVRLSFDDREMCRLAAGADAAGLALPEYLRGRLLKEARRGRSAEPAGGIDLFSPAPLAAAPVERALAPLSADMRERIDAYYAPELGFGAGSQHYRRGRREAAARPGGFTRLGHFLIELVRVRSFGHRVLPPEGALLDR